MNFMHSKIALLLIGLLSLVVVHPIQGARRTRKYHKKRDLEESLSAASVDDVEFLWKENLWYTDEIANSMSMNMTDMRKYIIYLFDTVIVIYFLIGC